MCTGNFQPSAVSPTAAHPAILPGLEIEPVNIDELLPQGGDVKGICKAKKEKKRNSVLWVEELCFTGEGPFKVCLGHFSIFFLSGGKND